MQIVPIFIVALATINHQLCWWNKKFLDSSIKTSELHIIRAIPQSHHYQREEVFINWIVKTSKVYHIPNGDANTT